LFTKKPLLKRRSKNTWRFSLVLESLNYTTFALTSKKKADRREKEASSGRLVRAFSSIDLAIVSGKADPETNAKRALAACF